MFHGEIEEVIGDDFVHLAMHAGIGLQLGRLSGTPGHAINVVENHKLGAQRAEELRPLGEVGHLQFHGDRNVDLDIDGDEGVEEEERLGVRRQHPNGAPEIGGGQEEVADLMPNIGGAGTRVRETIGRTQILIRKMIEQATSGRCDAR